MEGSLCPPDDPDFCVIETLAFRPQNGLVRRDRHLRRMARTAAVLGLRFDRARALQVLDGIGGSTPLRCRLTLAADGALTVTTGPLPDNPPVWQVSIAATRLTSRDVWLQHKTSERSLYDTARAALPSGIDEWIFLNEKQELCEGTITNLFLNLPGGGLLTPGLSSGVLPGVLREELIDNKQVTEATLTLTDLQAAEFVYVGNSLRGLIRAELANL